MCTLIPFSTSQVLDKTSPLLGILSLGAPLLYTSGVVDFIQFLALYAFPPFLFFCFFLVVNSIFHFFSRPSSEKLGRVILLHPITNFLSTSSKLPTSSRFLARRYPLPSYHALLSSSTSIGNLYLSSPALLSHLPQLPLLMTPDTSSNLRRGCRRTLSCVQDSSRARRSKCCRDPRLYSSGDATSGTGQNIYFEYYIHTGLIDDRLPSRHKHLVRNQF